MKCKETQGMFDNLKIWKNLGIGRVKNINPLFGLSIIIFFFFIVEHAFIKFIAKVLQSQSKS